MKHTISGRRGDERSLIVITISIHPPPTSPHKVWMLTDTRPVHQSQSQWDVETSDKNLSLHKIIRIKCEGMWARLNDYRPIITTHKVTFSGGVGTGPPSHSSYTRCSTLLWDLGKCPGIFTQHDVIGILSPSRPCSTSVRKVVINISSA